MQDKISDIKINNIQYRKLKLQNIVTDKPIYRFGEFCDVKLVRIQQSQGVVFTEEILNKKYALKVIYKERIRGVSDNYQRQYQYIFNQIYALYLISHPNVVKIYWHSQDDQNIYILTEHAGLNLYKYIHKNTINQAKIKHIFKQICQGLEAIHSKKIVHRDLSLENIVINIETNEVKIIDFGNAIEFTGGRTTALGTLAIMAPQVYHQRRYNSKADVWSLGVILFELFHKRNPFVNQEQQYSEGEFSQKRDSLQYTIDESIVSESAKRLIVKMLSINPEHRPLPQQILTDKWVTDQQPIKQKSRRQNQSLHQDQNSISINHAVEQQDKKTKQMSNRKSLFALTENQLLAHNHNKTRMQQPLHQQLSQEDDFYFDKIINKMTLNNSTQQLQQRLRILMKIRTNELIKNKQLTLKLLSSVKRNLQNDFIPIKS